MAHIYSLSNGDDEVIFNANTVDNPFLTARWLMQTPNPSQLPAVAEGSDSAPAPWDYTFVTETIEFRIFQYAGDDLQTQVRRVQTMIDKARLRQKTGAGPRVYIQAYMDNAEGTWRSELLSGRLNLTNGLDQWQRTNQIDAALSYTRRAFWEEEEEQLTLYSSEDTTGTLAVDAYNDDDATPTATNYVLFGTPPGEIGADGVLPAPMRIDIENQAGATLEWRDLFLCNWVSDNSTVIDPFLLGAEASGGASVSVSTSETARWRWTPTILTSTRLSQYAGKPYHLLVAFSTGAGESGVYLRAVVEAYRGGATREIYRTGLVSYNGEGLVDLGVVPIPPGGYDRDGAGIAVTINAFRPAGAVTMAVDFVQITPAGEGVYERLRQIDFTAAVGDSMVADGIENRAYLDDGGGFHLPLVRRRSLPLLLYPHHYNRLRVLFNEAAGFSAGRKMTVRIWYRKRRLDI